MITTEGRTQLAIYRSELRTNQDTSHRETVTDTLGYRNDIRTNTSVLVSKELTRTAITALDFITDKYCIVLVAQLTQALHEFRSYQTDTAYPLDTFNHHRTDITLCQFCFPSREIVHRQISHMTVGIDRRNDFRIVSSFYGQRSTAMKCLFLYQYTGTSVVERSQLQRIFISLSTTINQEELIIIITGKFAQTIGQLLLQLIDDGVGIEAQLCHLVANHFHIMRVSMTNRDHSMTTIKVEIFIALIIPHVATFSLNDIDIEQGIYIV